MADVVIVGAGLAGLQCARILGRTGLRIVLVDAKRTVSERVHTTGIFVRRTLEDFDLPPDCLGPPIRHVTVYSPGGRQMDLGSPHDEYRVGDMAALYEWFLSEARQCGVAWRPSRQLIGIERFDDGIHLHFRSGDGLTSIRARFVIGADGASSRVGAGLGLSVNREWIVGVENVYSGVPLTGEPRFHCFLDPSLAPGYLAWVVNDGREAHIGVAGYAAGFSPRAALDRFQSRVAGIVDLSWATLVETRGGRIPVGGVLKRIACRHGLLVGDAAGAVSPLTAGGLDPCLRLSSLAAGMAAEYLGTSDFRVLDGYDGAAFRRRFRSRIWLRRAIKRVRHPLALEAGFRALNTPFFRPLAGKFFFGRGSFPDSPLPARAARLADSA